MSLLDISGLSKRYGQQTALDNVDLAVPSRSRTAIVGPSGSGKTTLLRIIAGFETPDSGRVALDGQVLADGPLIAPAHRRGIGYVPQDGALFPHLSVAENIGFGIEAGDAGRGARIAELMDMIELDRSMLTRRPHELSGGQQQRVALARALARRPALMLLDEPFSALDAGLREAVRKSVARVLQQAGITTILVTHDQAEALSFADQVAVLRQGRLAQAGTPHALYWRPRDRDTALFLGDAAVLEAEFRDGFVSCALGRIPTEADARPGTVTIMLRPEQIRLSPAGIGQGEAAACHGEVDEIEFGGSLCAITVVVEANGARQRILVHASSLELPAPGTRVRLDVVGKAHILER
ncbi:ABC transporter ATP-binding protein [Bosea sp. BK604]|uniref:ABC transporter ATP-binding protein n=1 Tax=Bosea sp. BK604 TaxID=2512180 RepID=UPI0010506111|nr:ABC transporter ATP-binding protein [Bosea sp. BK604]TCR64219.1 iron(III) transport system ATP-binding protein [Bosea sp. BK604]